MRIAQMVVNRLPEVKLEIEYTENIVRNDSNRTGGFGSTGVN
jgi:dUTPase